MAFEHDCVCVGVVAIFAILLCILSHQFIEVVHVALLFFFFLFQGLIANSMVEGHLPNPLILGAFICE